MCRIAGPSTVCSAQSLSWGGLLGICYFLGTLSRDGHNKAPCFSSFIHVISCIYIYILYVCAVYYSCCYPDYPDDHVWIMNLVFHLLLLLYWWLWYLIDSSCFTRTLVSKASWVGCETCERTQHLRCLDRFAGWLPMGPAGFCHGDSTPRIVVTNHQSYLIRG